MPTYQYRCRDCGDDLEVVQSFTDDPLTECPNCHGTLRKVFAAPGISFKGSGFYKTDSRSSTSPGTKSDTSEKADAKTNGSSSEKSSDAGSSTTTAKKEKKDTGKKAEAKTA